MDRKTLKNKNISWKMRAILVDWLIKISDEQYFKRDTIYYAINYLDRFIVSS